MLLAIETLKQQLKEINQVFNYCENFTEKYSEELKNKMPIDSLIEEEDDNLSLSSYQSDNKKSKNSQKSKNSEKQEHKNNKTITATASVKVEIGAKHTENNKIKVESKVSNTIKHTPQGKEAESKNQNLNNSNFVSPQTSMPDTKNNSQQPNFTTNNFQSTYTDEVSLNLI